MTNAGLSLQKPPRPVHITAMSLTKSLLLSRAPLLAFAGLGLFWGAFAAQVPDLKAGINVGDGAFGVALLCGAIGALGAMWVAPRFDIAMGTRAIQISAIFLAFAFLLPGLAPSLLFFGAAMFFCGATSGLIDIVINARVTRLEAAHSTNLMNLNHAVFSFAYAASAFATGLAREARIDPTTVFMSISAIMVLLSIRMVTSAPSDPADDTQNSGKGYFGVALWTGLIMLVAFMTEQSTEAWSALHIERTFNAGAAEGAFGPTLLGLTMGIGRLTGHFVTPQGREGVGILGAALVTGSGAALAALAESQTLAYFGFAILGLGVSVMAPLAIALAGQSVRPKDRALAVSRAVMVGYVGFFIGPPLMGFVSEGFGLRTAFGMIATLSFLAPLCLWPLRAQVSSQVSSATRPQTPSE